MELLILTLLGYPLSILANFTYDQLKKLSHKIEDINPLKDLFLKAFYTSLEYQDKYHDDYSKKIIGKLREAVEKDEDKLLMIFSKHSDNFNNFFSLVKSRNFQRIFAEEIISEYSLDFNKDLELIGSIITDWLSYYQSAFSNQMSENKENNSPNSNEMSELVDRFISVYTNHGLSRTQISSFINGDFNFKISDFMDNDNIIKILDDKILNWTCNTFCIERDWLDGTSEEIYQHRNYYKNVEGFIRLFVKLKNEYRDDFTIYLIKDRELDPSLFSQIENFVIIILRYPLKKINRKVIYAYVPISTQWKWGYWRTRYQLKSIIYICNKLYLYTHMVGYDMDMETINKISCGQIFPGPEIDKLEFKQYTWYPEDYIGLPSESVKAKETTETEEVRKYILNESYLDYFEKEKEKYSW